ncbi:hypothetical protein [Streptomyces sp. NPDC096012]|uniref:hypothetical protein n=1 Tax=Streptomyces sp. NPDC096012 TaxID=3155684 RepID=UPI00336AAAA9
MEQRIGSKSKPSEGEPTEAEPSQPELRKAKPVKAEPTKADPAKAVPANAGSAGAGSAEADAGSVKDGSPGAGSVKAGSGKATSVTVGPVKAEPVTGAGFDPAFIPGITTPAPAPAEAAVPAQAEAQDAVRDADAVAEAGARPAEPADEDEAAEGPVFEAADRRARIVADRRGVRLSLDEESCEFRWDEIAAIETESPRFGRRYTVTVHTPDRRWYPIEVEAKARSRFEEWDGQLDAVLDAYFDDGESDQAG